MLEILVNNLPENYGQNIRNMKSDTKPARRVKTADVQAQNRVQAYGRLHEIVNCRTSAGSWETPQYGAIAEHNRINSVIPDDDEPRIKRSTASSYKTVYTDKQDNTDKTVYTGLAFRQSFLQALSSSKTAKQADFAINRFIRANPEESWSADRINRFIRSKEAAVRINRFIATEKMATGREQDGNGRKRTETDGNVRIGPNATGHNGPDMDRGPESVSSTQTVSYVTRGLPARNKAAMFHAGPLQVQAPAPQAWQQLMAMTNQQATPVSPIAKKTDPGQAHVGPQSNAATNPIGTFGLNTQSGGMSGFGVRNNVG